MKNNFIFVLFFSIVLILDQTLKYIIRSFFTIGSSLNIKIFSITYITNTGMSFGLFKGVNLLFVIISVIVLVFFSYIYYKQKKYPMQLSLICAGIVGNLIDRIAFGHVIDYIDFGFFPVFNIADAAISTGIVWLIFVLWRKGEDLI